MNASFDPKKKLGYKVDVESIHFAAILYQTDANANAST